MVTSPIVEALINLEDEPGKTVGRRLGEGDAFEYGMRLQKAATTFQKESDLSFVPKGVYRFGTHEEADEWLMTMMLLAAARRNQS